MKKYPKTLYVVYENAGTDDEFFSAVEFPEDLTPDIFNQTKKVGRYVLDATEKFTTKLVRE